MIIDIIAIPPAGARDIFPQIQRTELGTFFRNQLDCGRAERGNRATLHGDDNLQLWGTYRH